MDQRRLHSACESGDLKEIQQLHARGADMDVTRPDGGWTPMFEACFYGHFEIVQWLYAHGAAMDVTRPNNYGETPMLYACAKGYLEIVQWLHAHGAAMDVTRPRNDGVTPMFIACHNGHFEIVQFLLTHGADTDVMRPSFQGKTPMDIACEKGHLNIVQHLIRHHRILPDTLEQWHPRLSSSNKIQLRQVAHENLFDCQSFLTFATIVCYIKTEPYEVMNEAGRLVVPRSSILIFRRQVVKRHLLWMIAGYICGGEETRHIWHLIRKNH